MGYRKYAAIGIVAAMLLAGCSAEVKKSAEKEDIARATEEMTGEVSEDNGSLETSAVDQTYQSDGTQEGCSVSRTFSDYLKREFDIKEIEDEQTYFNSMSSKGQLICRDNVTCFRCMTSPVVLSSPSLLTMPTTAILTTSVFT